MEETVVPLGATPGIDDYIDLAINTVLSSPMSLLTENWKGLLAVIVIFIWLVQKKRAKPLKPN